MRVCFWSTTFQADNQALAHYLANEAGWDVTVATPCPEALARDPLALPFRGTLLNRDAPETKRTLGSQPFDVVVLDNHVPSYRCAERVFVLWHGFGWRVDDLKTMRKELGALLGDVTKPNPHFRWQAIGDWDRQYRVQHSRLASENVLALGSPYSDWLLPESARRIAVNRSALQPHYSIPLDHKVVLLGLTWHHGGSLAHWGDEEALLGRVVEHIAARGAVTLLRMHDRHRYPSSYVKLLERVATRFPRALMLKWKDESPNSLADLLLSDVCVSNYSSLLNAYYYTERPSIHIDPHDARSTTQRTYKMFMGIPISRRVRGRDQLWKLAPDENGGLRAQSFEQLLSQLDVALAYPDCCRARSRAFVSRYVTAANGQSCARVADVLRAWVGPATH